MKKEGMVCVTCGKTAKKAKLRFQGTEIGGWRCSCGEEYFDPEQAQRILLLNKLLAKEYKIKLGQIRSNLIIRIPTELAEALGLHKGEKVLLRLEGLKKLHIEAA
ncbi:MAG: AbrB/MazE/SpoVT family DNA-binding domain-containing protein [Thermoplasmata archaeon]